MINEDDKKALGELVKNLNVLKGLPEKIINDYEGTDEEKKELRKIQKKAADFAAKGDLEGIRKMKKEFEENKKPK